MTALLLAALLQSANAQDLSAMFTQNADPRGPLYPAGAQVELWGVASLTIPEGMHGTISYGSFILEDHDRTVRLRVEHFQAAGEVGSDGKGVMTFEMKDLREAYGGMEPEDKEDQQATPIATVQHATAKLRVLAASDEGEEGPAKKAVKAVGEALRTPAEPFEGEATKDFKKTRLTPEGGLEHGFFLDLCPDGVAIYRYDGNKPIGGAVPVAESAQEATGTWSATDSVVKIEGFNEGTALLVPRDGKSVTGFTTSKASCASGS